MLIRRGMVVVLLGVSAWTAPSASAAAADPEPPVLSNFAASPSTLTHPGGSVLLEVDAVDADGIDAVGATVYLADGGVLGLPLTAEDPGSPNTFSGNVEIPGNVTGDTLTHSVEISARDTVGDETLELMGNIDVEAQPPFDEAPDVFDAELDPTALPHPGGDVIISASATDDRAISEVYAVVTDPEGAETVVPLDGVSASRYSGTWTAPSNATPDDVVHTVQVSALDDIGQQDIEDAGDVTVAGDSSNNEPPVLSDFFADPLILGYEGGPVVLEVKAIDDDGIETVGATVHLVGGGDLDVPLSVEDPGSPDTYSGEVDIPGNVTDHSLTHTVEVAARDVRGAEASETMGVVLVWPEVLDDEPPHVFDPDLDPGTLPPSGGLVSMSVSATDNVGVTQVQAKVYDANGIVDYFDLLGEPGTRYSGAWSAPANDTAEDQHYDVHITAYDDVGNTDFVQVGFSVAGTPPAISRLALSQRRLVFGPVRAGKSVLRSVVLHNRGAEPVECTVRSPARRFRLPGRRDLSLTLEPGQAKRVKVRYRSAAAGRHWARLKVVRSDGRQPGLRVVMKGTATRRR